MDSDSSSSSGRATERGRRCQRPSKVSLEPACRAALPGARCTQCEFTRNNGMLLLLLLQLWRQPRSLETKITRSLVDVRTRFGALLFTESLSPFSRRCIPSPRGSISG